MNKVCIRRCVCLALCLMLTMGTVCGAIAEDGANVIYSVGSKGDAVLAAQQRLIELGYYDGEADGEFGEALKQAVLMFQMANGLLETGELDSVTLEVLESEETLTFANWTLNQIVAYESDSVMTAEAPSASAPSSGAFMQSSQKADFNANEYTSFTENRFLSTATSPLSTFAADVDTASYAQLRAMILRGESVPESAVRIEEMLNYFKYDYAQPKDGEPFGVTMELADCPWSDKTKLMLIGLQAKEVSTENRPRQNLVFLIDVSGSMNSENKLPLVKRAFLLLLEQLDPTDTVSIVTYASRDEVVIDGIPARDKVTIMQAINDLEAGGMTAGADGIKTAYELARKHFIEGGNNRILLATDGDLNVGVSDEGSLARLVSEERKSGVFMSVLGFGNGNYKDNKMEALADYGNGNYNYIDTIYEARKALVDESGGTFLTVCKDVKLQLDFNPAYVKGYRLIGYEDRLMAAEDFDNDEKDGGEIGSGHRVTVLYELVPAGSDFDIGETESRYQTVKAVENGEWLTLSVRAKEPEGDKSDLYSYPLKATGQSAEMSDSLRFAAAVAEVGMLLSGSEWKGSATYSAALELMRGCKSLSGDPYKEELLYMTTLLERAEK